MKAIFTLLAALMSLNMMAQTDRPQRSSGQVNRKYQVLVELNKPSAIIEQNKEMQAATDNAKASANKANAANSGEKSAFLQSLATGFGTALIPKTQSVTTSLMSAGINYMVDAMTSDSKKWYSRALSHCTLTRKLKSETTIKDFYSAPSALGAMDPQNIQFKGFGCRHYLEESNNKDYGKEVFFVFCSMRRDSVGISSIVNHSKFLVDIDSLVFNPKYCGLPNDSLETITAFDFAKRSDLTLTIKTRIYSSWLNEAIMITNDYLLGEFTVTAKIDSAALKDSVFVYKKDDPRFRELVSVDGDCFIVPRSFTGTNNGETYSPTWGTGQYRIEMDVYESCKINNDYYLKEKYKDRTSSKSHFAAAPQRTMGGTPDLHKFDKAKWQPEWQPLKARLRKNKGSFWSSTWGSIVTVCQGTDWVQTFTEPLTTYIVNFEGQKLNEWFKLTPTTGAAATGKAGAAGKIPTGAAAGGAQQGGKPDGMK